MGEVVKFKGRYRPASPLDMLIDNWGEGDSELEEAIRVDCGQLLERYSALPALSLQLPVVDHLSDPDQLELADALRAQINGWASEWHTKMLFEMLGSEILRLRELHGYGPVPGQPT